MNAVHDGWTSLTYSMKGARDQIYHSTMPIIEEEKQAFFVAQLLPEAERIFVDNQTQEIVPAFKEVDAIARKMGMELSDSSGIAVEMKKGVRRVL